MSTAAALAAARTFRAARGAAIVRDFVDLLSLPNVTGDVPALEANATEIVRRLVERGAEVRPIALPGVAPVVIGRLPASRPTRSLGVYVHYDGQPVDPSAWSSEPFVPIVRTARLDQGGEVIPVAERGSDLDPEARIYARGAADDKAPIQALLAALDALAASGVERRTELVFLLEGEEEAGSPNLREYMKDSRDLLQADVWLICDGPVHPSGRPQVAFGVRGYCGFDLTVYGPERELHSGHFGNWVPNPAHDLSRLIATFKDDDGEVLIEGFYDSTMAISDADRAAAAALPPVEDQYQEDLGFGGPEAPSGSYPERLLRPSFNVRGLAAATTGAGARNVIPSEASVSVDIRLAAGNDPIAMLDLVETHIRSQGYTVIERDPTPGERRTHRRLARFHRDIGYPASRLPVGDRAGARIAAAAELAAGEEVVRLPTFGGSVPLHHFREELDAAVVVLPIANYDNNQHAANENLRLGNLWYGMDLWAVLLAGDV